MLLYLNVAPCWTVHPLRAKHLDLIPVRSGTPVPITPALHRAADLTLVLKDRREVTKDSKERVKRVQGRTTHTHTPVC